MQISAGTPQKINETLLVEVAHYEPMAVTVSGEGVFPAVALTLPRVKDELFESCLAEVHEAQLAALAAAVAAGAE